MPKIRFTKILIIGCVHFVESYITYEEKDTI